MIFFNKAFGFNPDHFNSISDPDFDPVLIILCRVCFCTRYVSGKVYLLYQYTVLIMNSLRLNVCLNHFLIYNIYNINSKTYFVRENNISHIRIFLKQIVYKHAGVPHRSYGSGSGPNPGFFFILRSEIYIRLQSQHLYQQIRTKNSL